LKKRASAIKHLSFKVGNNLFGIIVFFNGFLGFRRLCFLKFAHLSINFENSGFVYLLYSSRGKSKEIVRESGWLGSFSQFGHLWFKTGNIIVFDENHDMPWDFFLCFGNLKKMRRLNCLNIQLFRYLFGLQKRRFCVWIPKSPTNHAKEKLPFQYTLGLGYLQRKSPEN
jgi:hypothetical protein